MRVHDPAERRKMTNPMIPAEASDDPILAYLKANYHPDAAADILAAAQPLMAFAWEQGWMAREDLHAYDVWGGDGEEPDSSNPYKKEAT